MLEDMADFVANDSHEFIVIHDVHQRGENAHATVRACKGVDVDYMEYFKVQRYSIGIRYTLGKLAQTNSIGIVFGKNGVVLVHPVDRLLDVRRHLGISKSDSLRSLGDRVPEFFEIQLCSDRRGCSEATN